jgi:hypothetical protein
MRPLNTALSRLQNNRWLLTIAFAVTCLASSPVQAKAPKGRYTIANGEVTDNMTGLIWRQALNPGAVVFADVATVCTGLANGPWRVPNVKELATLLDPTTNAPAIDAEVFPKTPVAPMWSSTPDARDAGYAFAVDFGFGDVGHYAVDKTYQVRCVK